MHCVCVCGYGHVYRTAGLFRSVFNGEIFEFSVIDRYARIVLCIGETEYGIALARAEREIHLCGKNLFGAFG